MTNADDMADLMTQLGHEKFHLHGEDRGADYAYALAAKYRERVLTLSFCEMQISGFGLEETSFWTAENVNAQFEKRGVWCWHLGFFFLPHVPEMLITGKERVFWVGSSCAELFFSVLSLSWILALDHMLPAPLSAAAFFASTPLSHKYTR